MNREYREEIYIRPIRVIRGSSLRFGVLCERRFPLKLNDDVYVLALPLQRDGQTAFLNLSLIPDATYGPTLIDTGLPGQHDAIASALAEVGLRVQDLQRIILTHQD